MASPSVPPSATVAPAARTRRLAPEDLYRLRVPTAVQITPDAGSTIFVVQTANARRDAYTQAIWLAPTDGSGSARQLTIGGGHDNHPRVSPDGRWLAFLSDRREATEKHLETDHHGPGAPAGGRRGPEPPSSGPDREDTVQVYVLPLDGPGEAHRVTDLPRGVDSFEWSPDGRRLAVLSSSVAGTHEEDRKLRGLGPEDDPHPHLPRSDYRYIERLSFLFNGRGCVYDRRPQLWVVDVESGGATRLTEGPADVAHPAWSPDGRSIAYVSNDREDWDFDVRSLLFAVDVETGVRRRITDDGKIFFDSPAWLPDGRTIAALGHRFPAHGGSRMDVWVFAADGSDARPDGGRNLSGHSDLMPAPAMNSDVTVGEDARLFLSRDGAWIRFLAPVDGSVAIWRIATSDGHVERLTEGHEYISTFDAAGDTFAFIRSTPVELPDAWVMSPGSAPRRLSSLNDDALDGVQLVAPSERWYEVDGRRVQGWVIEPSEATGFRRPGPMVVEIHGGPQTQYGWSPFMEFQILAANGIAVFYCNPRGSTGYGQAFADGNFRDWGDGPMRDVVAGVDLLISEGLADPARLGVTGGSYGGYLTNWIVGHTRRFRAALTCRSVSDLATMKLTGDLAGLDDELDFGSAPWEDPEFYRQQSPITYIKDCTTPLLIQHAEQDLRCPIGQAEELFAILRANGRPVRFMRVPGESHELTRSGTPYRRAENLIQVRDWFRHFLVAGRRSLPPLPAERAGK